MSAEQINIGDHEKVLAVIGHTIGALNTRLESVKAAVADPETDQNAAFLPLLVDIMHVLNAVLVGQAALLRAHAQRVHLAPGIVNYPRRGSQ